MGRLPATGWQCSHAPEQAVWGALEHARTMGPGWGGTEGPECVAASGKALGQCQAPASPRTHAPTRHLKGRVMGGVALLHVGEDALAGPSKGQRQDTRWGTVSCKGRGPALWWAGQLAGPRAGLVVPLPQSPRKPYSAPRLTAQAQVLREAGACVPT